MAYPTAVNNQITDAVTQTNLMALGVSPAVAAGTLYQAVAQAMGNAANNATVAQQGGAMMSQAVAATGTAIIYSQKPSS